MATKKSQLVLTCNAQAIKDVFEYLNDKLAKIKLRRDALLRQYEGKMWTAEAKKEFKQLGDDIAAITSMQQKNEEEMRKYGQVMQDLSGSKLRDVKGAVREVSSALNKMTVKDPNRQKLIDDLAKLKNQISVIGGSRRSLSEVTADLKNLSNVRFDHLQQDLEAVRAKYAQLSETQRQGSVGQSLKNSERLLTAQMAVAQTPVSVTPVSTLTAQQLRSEQSALNNAMAATNGVKGYEQYGIQAAARLKAVNEQLTILSEKEKQAAADARNLTKTQEAADVVQAVYRNLTVSLEELDATYKTLESRANKFAGVNPAKAKVAQQQMAAVAARIKEIKSSMQEEIRIDKQFLRNATNQQLQAALSQLQQKLQGLNSTQKKEADAIVADMKRVKNQIDQNTAAVNNQKNAWGSLGTTLKNLTAYVGVFAMFNKLKGLFEDFISKNREFSDQLANVRKVSNLAMSDIKELANNLSKIDSRTSLKGLMELSYTGAKLGFGNYGIEGLESFAKSAVKVQNALSEDMGADAMTALSKMVEVMGLIPKMGVERAMDATGSAIFKLASTSTATGTNIVEFSKRLMGLANIAHITTPELLAIGSAADSMALMPEVAATAFNKLITAMQKQPNLIEDALKIDKGTISDLYQAGKMTDAMVLVFEKMREKGGMNALMQSGVFKDLGSDGARLVAVMATMANRVDMLNAHLAVSRQAFEEGTAVAQEYAIQMDTAAAYSERAANIIEKAFVNPEGVDVVKEFSKAWYEVAKSLTTNETFMLSIKLSLQGILLLLKGIMTILPELMAMLLSGGFAMLIANLRTSEGLLASLTSWFGKLTVAQKAFFKAAGWVGLAMTIYEVGKAIYDLANKTKEAAVYMKGFKKDLFDLDVEFGKAETELHRYKKAIDEATMGTKQRTAAITNFNSKFGTYLKNLLTEKSTVDDVYAAYQRVLQVMRAKIALQLKEKDINAQVLPREQWTAERRQEYDKRAKEAGLGQYGTTWITSYAQDNADKTIDVMIRDIGKRFYNLPKAVIEAVVTQAKDGNTEFNNYGNLINSRYLKQANTLLGANAYLRQDRSAQNALNRVNQKWKPEQDAIDAYLASLQQDEPIGPLEPLPEKGDKGTGKKLREEFKDAKEAATGIISKLEEYYRLQEAAIQEARADGQLTEDQAKEMVRSLNILKNESLATARRAVTTGDTKEWKNIKEKVLPVVMSDTSDVSKNLLETIQKVSVEKLHNDLNKFNGSKEVFGLDSRAFFDLMNAKAAGNTREAARLKAAIQNEIQKALRQYQFVDLAVDKMRKDLETMGFVTETYEQFAKRMQQGIDEKPDTLIGLKQPKRDQIVGNYMGQYGAVGTSVTNTNDAEQMQNWLSEFSQGGNAEWASGLPNIKKWLEDAESHLPEIQRFYVTLEEIRLSAQQREREGGNPMDIGEQQSQTLDQLFGHTISDQDAFKQMGNKFIQQGVINYKYNIENRDEAEKWVKQFATDAQGDLEDWANAFPDLVQWIDLIKRKEQGKTLGEEEAEALEQAMPKIRNLYNEMLNHSDRVNKAIKQSYEHEKQQQDIRFQVAGYRKQEAETDKSLETVGKQKDTGIGASFLEQQGLGSIAEDPEIQRIQNRIYWRGLEVQDAQERLDEQKKIDDDKLKHMRDNFASEAEIEAMRKQQQQDRAGLEELLKARQTQLFEETSNMAAKLSQEMQKRVQTVNNLTKPIQEGAKNIGKKFGDMIRGVQEDSMTWNEIWKNMALAVAESMLSMAGQYAQNLIVKQAMNKAEVADEGAKATAITMFGIAEGSAKTIGTLGWIGIALIPVITSLLMGLLTSALSTANGSDSSANASNAAVKTKLATGMLTYDKGNVDTVSKETNKHRYLGNDGRIYTATDEPAPKTGLVKQPIATTVQGQPALVAERGPEIVIGRETTENIMRNAPELLQAIVDIDRNPHKKPEQLPTYDKGNVSDTTSSEKITEDIATEMVRKHRQVDEQRRLREEQEQKRSSVDERSRSDVQEVRRTFDKGNVEEVTKRRRLDTSNTEEMTRWLRDFVTTDVTSLEDVRSQKEDVTKKSAVSSKKSDVQDTSTVSHQTSDIKNREVRESFTKAMPHVDEWLQEPEKHQQEIVQLYTTLTDIDERERISREEEQTYKAQPGAVPEGVSIITKPIATMINGEPSLVAEKGPELVIGRETTKMMQMNRPDLLRALVSFDKNKTQQSMRLFDQGNVGDIAGRNIEASEYRDNDNAERQALINRLDRSDALMEQVLYFLQNPVAPEIAMYDKGGKQGLYSKVKEAGKFMARYGG